MDSTEPRRPSPALSQNAGDWPIFKSKALSENRFFVDLLFEREGNARMRSGGWGYPGWVRLERETELSVGSD